MVKSKGNIYRELFLSIISILLISCSFNQQKVYLKKIKGSPAYEDSSLEIIEIDRSDEKYNFSFDINNYDLGIQTKKEFNYDLANSVKGQHIHFILNNGPYSAHYDQNFDYELPDGNNLVLAFLSRSYHESVKNPNAYILTQIGDSNKINLESEFLFYSRPKGTYEGLDTEKLLLDFYLVNTKLSATGNKVKLTIKQETFPQGTTFHQFMIDSWDAYYIEGLDKGDVTIKLELVNNEGNLIETPFNPSERVVTLK